MQTPSATRPYTRNLQPGQADIVGIEMNIALRSTTLSIAYAEAFNAVFRAIFGHDHESMERRRQQALG